jgi:hypothetical protein
VSWKQEDGWNRPGDRSLHRRPRDRHKPAPPVKADSGEVSTWEAERRRSDKRRRRGRAAWIVAGALAVLLVLVGAAPMLASILAPGLIASGASRAIAGKVEVSSVSLRWFGGQRVERVRIADDTGAPRADLSISADRGLLALALGDYGEITLRGEVDLSTDARGRTFLEHTLGIAPSPAPGTAPAPGPGSPAPPPAIPGGLRAALVLDNLRLTYSDESAKTPLDAVRLDKLSGRVALDGAGPARADFSAAVELKAPADRVFRSAGSIVLRGEARDLIDKDGALRPNAFTLDAEGEVKNLATALLDILPDLAGRGEPALGALLGASFSAKGPASDLAVTLAARSDSIDLHAPVRVDLKKGSLRSAGAIVAALDLARLSMLVPDRDALLGPEGEVHVTEYPRLTLTVDDLALPIPPADPADLRGAGLRLRAEIGRLAAGVRTPGDDARRAVGFEPATVSLDAPDLGAVVTLTSAIDTTVDGARSGTLRIDLAAQDLLDARGAVRAGAIPRVRGGVRGERLALAAFQPIAMAAGFDLTGLLGQTADLALEATTSESGDTTDFTLSAGADHASLAGSLRLEGNTLRATGEGVSARLDRLAPLLAGPLAGSGVELREASGGTLRVSELEIDLARVGAGDYSGVRVVAEAGLGRLAAALPETGDLVEASGFTLRAASTPLREGLTARATGAFRFRGQQAGSLEADVRAGGLLDAAGALTGGLPGELAGTVAARAVRTEVLQPFLAQSGIVLAEDIGPTIDLALEAKASPAPGESVPPTDLVLSLASRHLNGAGTLRLTGDRLATTGEGLRLAMDNPGPILRRFVELSPGAAVRDAGTLAVTMTGLDVPLDPASREPDLPKSAGVARVELGTLRIADGENNGEIERLLLTATLRPGQSPRLDLDGAIRSLAATGNLRGNFELLGAFDPPGPDGARAPVLPVGALAINGLPMSLLRLSPVELQRADGRTLPLSTFVEQTLGAGISARLTTARGDAGALAVDLVASNARHRLDSKATLRPGPGGAFEVSALEADGSLQVSQLLVRTILLVFAPAEYRTVEIPRESALKIGVRTDQAGVATAELTLEPTTIANLPVPEEGGRVRRLEPVTVGMKSTLSAPLALASGGAGTHAVRLDATLDGFDAPSGGKKLLELSARGGASLREMKPFGKADATVRLATERTDWMDALGGLNGMLVKAVGATIRADASLTGEADAAGALGTADASLEVRSPLLRTTSPIRLRTTPAAVELTAPFEASWDISPALFDALFPVEPGKAAQLRIARGLPLTIRTEQFRLPRAGGGAAGTSVRATVGAPTLPLLFPDGTEYAYGNPTVTLATLDQPGAARLLAHAIDPDRPGTRGLNLDATVRGLPDGAPGWTAEKLTLDGTFGLDGMPVRLLDTFAAGDGQLVELLGATLVVDSRVRNLPQRGGTISFDATTPQASSKLRATVRAHPADRDLLAVILDEPMRTQLTHFTYTIEGKKVGVLPIFGEIRKAKGTNRPGFVEFARLVAPVDGSIDKIIMNGTVDPGDVDYDFQRGFAALLRAAGQREQGVVGRSLKPFSISMLDGVARFEDLVVPVGEFEVSARGALDFVNQTEDIVVGVPAGAFADEVIGALPGAIGNTVVKSVVVPVRRKGPLGGENEWRPDFQAVIREMFRPEGILKDALQDRLEDLIRPRRP